ncbi:hypothetical protein OG689_10740 [Kitasatospora sp. NBC_00240]|uniref:hypothetical protein n=1 Tax=Kitasatospora sp. NBC_00240 TaxID=2903567 RepID=UPI002253A680|nr:hypothetical protein [Kitasatospora sp. NBC_00240]MCX5209760.1 hypothetical protein [Kitasatospora sp. NBC_00240]
MTDLPADLLDELIDVGNKALNDHYHERACSCSTWPAGCATRGHYFGMHDTDAFAHGLPAIIAAYEQHKAQQVDPVPELDDFEVPRYPVTDEEIAALPTISLDDFCKEQQ